ncbi:translation elongation factor Ts [Carboxylicivirga sp. M1479]|uniref:translation elongation factor Ts n=1 Tax=Carboxylicivirga sp. M1479 TaxID=2594476 RepID=UPI00117756B6|nr:translation elongation factor Ts [Carboxylicivirga sp. M1479]TRX71190.1 elongation factor Ts [Carboxylicivirga sp. M1479]
MAITAADVSKLRKSTGAGMMDCKKALTEAEGDFDKAVEIIRKKGQAIANKRADREATEGVVLAKVTADKKRGALIVLNCETDFVAKNESYVDFAMSILDVAIAENPADLDALKALELNGRPVSEVVAEQSGVIGEKLDLAAYETVSAEAVTAYIHAGNKLATLVGFNQEGMDEQVGRDVAMQAAAMAPVALDADSVPEDVKAKELEIGKDMARNEGKPEAMLEKIAMGRLNKFFKENTLMAQAFVKDNKLTIEKYLDGASKGLKAVEFKRYTLNN